VSPVAHVEFELGMPADSTVEVWQSAGAIGLSVNLETPNTVDALATLSDALRRAVVEVDEQRALVQSILAERAADAGGLVIDVVFTPCPMCGAPGILDRPDLDALQCVCTECGWHYTAKDGGS